MREDFLAISTFGIAISLQLVALNVESVTRGPNGLYALPKPFAHIFDSPFVSNVCYLIICIVVITMIYYALERAVKSPWGRVLRSIREDEVAAEVFVRTYSCTVCRLLFLAVELWDWLARCMRTLFGSSVPKISCQYSQFRSM